MDIAVTASSDQKRIRTPCSATLLQDIITFWHQTRSRHKWSWVNRKYRHVCGESKCTKFFIKRNAFKNALKNNQGKGLKRNTKKAHTKQQKWEFESLLFSWVTLIQMNQAEPHPPTLPGESPISARSITITAALLNTNCFMWIPQAEGYINIELDKVLFFFFLCFIFPLFSHSPATSPGWVGSKQKQALTSKSCSSLMIALQKGFLLT